MPASATPLIMQKYVAIRITRACCYDWSHIDDNGDNVRHYNWDQLQVQCQRAWWVKTCPNALLLCSEDKMLHYTTATCACL